MSDEKSIEENQIEKTKDEKQFEKLDSIFADPQLDVDISLIYKPVDTNAILIVVFFIHLLLIFVHLLVLLIFDIFAFYFLFQIIRSNTDRLYLGISKHNIELTELRKKVKKLSKN